MNSLAADKAPGPDGFNIRSIKFLWPLIKDKVISFIQDFGEMSKLPAGVNSSFIVLIPKVLNPSLIKDFRPISLINSSMKILMKVLATRLGVFMEELVRDSQTGFMKNRQATESILIVKEVAHSIQSGRGKGFILKLDFEKAFDSVNWDFLFSTLEAMNFDQKWIRWIKSILESSRISVLVNGSPSKEFSPGKGLRQGDPLSPLLFNIVGEVLNSLMDKAASTGIFKGFSFGEDSKEITHLQYADDTIVFLDGTVDSARGVKKVLQCFQVLTGLKINYCKSEIFSASLSGVSLKVCADILGCQIGKWPMTYLGMPVGCSSRKASFWEPLLAKLEHKLARWKAEALNQAGRLTLLKSVVDSLPIYWMNLHLMPVSVTRKIEKIRRDFLWGNVGTKYQKSRKLHSVAWTKVCRPKNQGGLGISCIRARNLALLGKWCYRWEKERSRSWNCWIRSKYRCSKHEKLSELQSAKGISECLKSIKTVSEHPILKDKISSRSFKWKLKNGKSVLFWEDRWFENKILKDVFKRLYHLSNLKDITVHDMVDCWRNSKENSGFDKWTRKLRQWELEEEGKLEAIIQSIIFLKGEDELLWSENLKSYLVSSMTLQFSGQSEEVEWSFIWKIKIPHKIKLFLWKVQMNILHTKGFLVSRNILDPLEAHCPICRKVVETTDHLFLECRLARAAWKYLFEWWQINPIPHHECSFMSLWKQHKQFPSKKAKQVWKLSVSAALWCIWLVRNRTIFDNKETTETLLGSLIKHQAKEWCLAFNLIHIKAAEWWQCNPMGSLTFSERVQVKILKDSASDLSAFIDGSFKRKGQTSISGIGGIIFNKKNEIIFSFSGPSLADGPYSAEWQAFCFLLNAFSISSWRSHAITVFSDSKILVNNVLEIFSSGSHGNLRDFSKNIKWDNFSIRLIPSDLNGEADYLAKKGAQCKKVNSYWVFPRSPVS
ncbi:uncharacterized protein LOC135149664 [Daucus carota subsp. sativus]|uniref:uncharacterized protein LOC135149664 n=1 Tax=Daucus carota subsp. sativus TaxID=79200 RepID=UPI003082ECEA